MKIDLYKFAQMVSKRDLSYFLKSIGFNLTSANGPHEKYNHPNGRMVLVPKQNTGETFRIGTFMKMLGEMGLSKPEFLKLYYNKKAGPKDYAEMLNKNQPQENTFTPKPQPAYMNSNWYKKLVNADSPLPIVEGLPEENTLALEELDALDTETIEKENKLYPNLKYLGHGCHGLATEQRPEGRVIKYTTSIKELQSAKIILEQQKIQNISHLPGIVGVYDVREIKGNISSISMEKVRTLNDEEFLTFGYAFNGKRRYGHPVSEDEINQELFRKMEEGITIIKQTATELEMPLWDLHANNVGWNSEGELVLLDLGSLI